MFPFSDWFDSGYIFCQSTEAWSFPSWCRGGFPWSCCSAHHGVSTVAVLVRGDRCPWYAGTGSLHSCSSSTRSSFSISWRRGYFPWSDCSSRPSRFPYCCIWWPMSLLRCRAFSLSWRRGRFTWSRLLVGPLRFYSSSSTRCSMSRFCTWCEFTGAVVEKTVALPRLHSVRNSLCSEL